MTKNIRKLNILNNRQLKSNVFVSYSDVNLKKRFSRHSSVGFSPLKAWFALFLFVCLTQCSPQSSYSTMDSCRSADNVRLKLSTHLETIRSKIARGMLVLFVGEQASALTSLDNPYPSLDDWWQVINQSEVRAVWNSEIRPGGDPYNCLYQERMI